MLLVLFPFSSEAYKGKIKRQQSVDRTYKIQFHVEQSGLLGVTHFYYSDINECATQSPCQNDGKCSNTIGDYNCACSSAWMGKTCAFSELKVSHYDKGHIGLLSFLHK